MKKVTKKVTKKVVVKKTAPKKEVATVTMSIRNITPAMKRKLVSLAAAEGVNIGTMVNRMVAHYAKTANK